MKRLAVQDDSTGDRVPPGRILDRFRGEIVQDRPTLEAKFRGAAEMQVQPEFHLRPNKLVTYKHVAGVMASAQRLGITKIGLIGAEQFLD